MTAAPPTAPPPDVDDDDPEELPCYRHPDRMTALQCIECERPICTECAVTAAVGFKCPDDARVSKAARAAVPSSRILTGAATSLVVALAITAVVAFFGIGFFTIIIGYLTGMAAGELGRRASGGFRDAGLSLLVAIAAGVGTVALPIALFLADGADNLAYLIFHLLAGVAAALAAAQRTS